MGTPLPPPPPPPFVYSALPLPASVLSPPSCTATSLVFSGSIDGLICIKMDVFFVCFFFLAVIIHFFFDSANDGPKIFVKNSVKPGKVATELTMGVVTRRIL